MEKCNNGGVEIRIGDTPIDPCDYELLEKHRNVTVEVLRCKKCGHLEVLWFRQEDTTDEEVSE